MKDDVSGIDNPTRKASLARVVLVFCAFVIVGGAGVIMRCSADRKSAVCDRITAKHEEFCAGVKLAMQDDERDFLSGNPARQDAAYDRFYASQIMFHNAASIGMCVAEIPDVPLACTVNKNWRCLADIAHRIYASLQ